MSKKPHTYKVVRTVEYSMLIEGDSAKEVAANYRVGQLDAYWTRKEVKRVITKLKGND